MVVTGYCGQVSFGQAAFMAVGAYASAIFTGKMGLPFWAALPLAGITAGVLGLIGGAPSLRIKGFYLALATLAIHFLIMWTVIRLELTGTTFGLPAPPPRIGGIVLDTDKEMYFVIMAVMVIMTFFAKNIVRSKTGRAFVAIRDNDLAAELLGINVFRYKLLAFFISTFYAGIAGSLWAHLIQVVHPEQFTLWHALWYIGMIIIGGVGTIVGVFFGVLFLRILDELVLFLSPALADMFPALGVHPAASLSLTLFGVVLIIFLVFEPHGIAHRWTIFKAYYRLHPFAH
jgi:branched-chain amino acid transport system permease protein